MRINGSQVRAGDTLDYGNGTVVQVVSVRPYTGPLLNVLGEGSQVATVWLRGLMTEMSMPAVSWMRRVESGGAL